MHISDWSSDVCSSDLLVPFAAVSLGVGSVPERSVFVPVLDLRHRHHVLLGARDVLWLVVPLWRLDRNRLSRRRCARTETLSGQTAGARSPPPEEIGRAHV